MEDKQFTDPVEQLLYECRKDKSGKMKKEKLRAIKDMVAELKANKKNIENQREKDKMALQCARTDLTPQGERNILNDIASYKRGFEKAKADLIFFEQKIREAEAKLPTSDRQAKVDQLQRFVEDKLAQICNISGQIEVYESLHKLIEKLG